MENTIGEIMAKALLDAGVRVVTSVPVSGANEVFDQFNLIKPGYNPISFHEESAYSIAHGAAITGTRSATLIKSHGIIKAGNSVSDSLFCGTTAGMLVIIFTDNQGLHSDSILDIESFLKGIGIPCQLADLGNVYSQVLHLLDQSEKLSLPHALVLESCEINRFVQVAEIAVTPHSRPEYRRNIALHLLCPFFNRYQSEVLNCKRNNGDFSRLQQPASPVLPGAMPDKWKPLMEMYAGFFSIFQKIRGSLVTGETGISSLFACEPYNCIDIATYMGGSIPLAAGAYLGGTKPVWAVTGDFAFVSAGHLGLLEALQRHLPLKIVVLYNGKSATTGGQPIPENTLETILRGYAPYVSYIADPDNPYEVETVLRGAQSSDELAIIVADYRNKS